MWTGVFETSEHSEDAVTQLCCCFVLCQMNFSTKSFMNRKLQIFTFSAFSLPRIAH